MLFFAATVLALECSLAFPALAGGVWASYGAAFGLTAVTLGVGAGIAGYRSARQGKGFWNGFAEHVHNNWSQEVAITSAIFIVSLGITTAKFAIENAVSKNPLIKAAKKRDYETLARLATHNSESANVMLGKYDGGGSTSYIARAGNEYTYFSLKEWSEISKIIGEKNMWKINEAFLKQQISLGKTFYASHNIFDASIGTSFYREINYLNDMKINLFQL